MGEDATPDDPAAPGGRARHGDAPTHKAPRRPGWWNRLLRAEERRARQRRSRSWWWRLCTPAAFAAAGALLMTSQINAGGTDLRPGRYDSLADLAERQSDRVQALRQDVTRLNGEIEQLTDRIDEAGLSEVQAEVEALQAPAGLTAVHGPGLTVTLDDAPASIRESAGDLVGDAIVHQQDIQAVVNALWAGGAEAMTIQDQRVVSTTGIKCVGNTVILHGVPYSPPYRISAIGDADEMRRSLLGSAYVQGYLQAVEVWQLGWDVEEEDDISVPAYEGSMELRYARPGA